MATKSELEKALKVSEEKNTQLQKDYEICVSEKDELLKMNTGLAESLESADLELNGTKKLLSDASEALVKAKADLGNQPKTMAEGPAPKNDGKSEWEGKYNKLLVEKRQAQQATKAMTTNVQTLAAKLMTVTGAKKGQF